jgi:hypothetical protein
MEDPIMVISNNSMWKVITPSDGEVFGVFQFTAGGKEIIFLPIEKNRTTMKFIHYADSATKGLKFDNE